jgi:hypothetical protein
MAPTDTGLYAVVASFTSTNPNYASAASSPVTFTVGKATPKVLVTDAGGVNTGQSFPASASVSGVAENMVAAKSHAWADGRRS